MSFLHSGGLKTDPLFKGTYPQAMDDLLKGGVVQDGDLITLDVAARSLHLHVDDAELARRLAAWQAPPPAMASGYWKLYIDHVLQADTGADLDFLRGSSGSAVSRESH